MPKTKFKTSECLNCGYKFNQDENYCPECGQENNDKTKAFRYFFKDFIDDVIQIDNRFYRSIRPFLFSPGKLSNAYISGQRKKYVTPIRLYLILSILYAFVLTWVVSAQNNKVLKQTNKDLVKKLAENNKEKFDTLKKKSDMNLRFVIADEIPVQKVERMFEAGLQADQIMDSLKIEKTFFNRLAIKQTIRLNNATPETIINYMIEKIPIVMFVLLPIFAFLLKLMYIRRKQYYIEHLIFTLHIHSFYFFIFIIAILALYFFAWYHPIFFIVMFSILILYSYKSFRNVYKQNRVKTLLKMFLLGLVYLVILSVGLLIGIIISLLLF